MKVKLTLLIFMFCAKTISNIYGQFPAKNAEDIVLEDLFKKLNSDHKLVSKSWQNKRNLFVQNFSDKKNEPILKHRHYISSSIAHEVDSLGNKRTYYSYKVFKRKLFKKYFTEYLDFTYEVVFYSHHDNCEIRIMNGFHYCVIFKNFTN